MDRGLIKGDVLDFGCGHGYDAEVFAFDKYDPHYFPLKPVAKYDTIVCHFVINTLPPEFEKPILEEIKSYLKSDGTAYVTVRRDVRVEGYRKTGTYQRTVQLNLPVACKVPGQFVTYILKKS